MSLSFSSTLWSYDSTSPYPPSSPSSSDSEYGRGSTHPSDYLRSSIAILPEAKLRNLMLKLASKHPHFQRTIIKELSHMDPSPTTPTTPTPAKQRKWHRKSRQNVKNLSISTKSLHEIEYMYHPGRLEEEVYEFISVLPDRTSHVVREVMMWSCCDEDEWSPGCIPASATAFPLHLRHRKSLIEFRHPDVSPDFVIERVRR